MSIIQNTEYELALNKINSATMVWRNAQTNYKMRNIDAETFLKARAIYDEAKAEFAIAFAKEENQY